MTSTGRTAEKLGLVTRVGVAAAVLGALVPGLLYLLDLYVLPGSIALFDLEEGALITWASSCAAFAVAAFALVLSVVDPAQRVRAVLVAAGAAFVSFDDAAFIHERVSYRVADELEISSLYVQVIWPVLYLPLLVALAALLWGIAGPTHEAHRLVVVGLGLLAGAVAMEALGHVAVRLAGEASVPVVLEAVVEESAELAGWTLVATGVAVRLVACLDQPLSSRRAAA